MNSLLYYYNNVQKMAAYQQAKRMQRGVSIGYGENNVTGTNKFNMPPISIGTSDFTLEYFGNAYGSTMAVANNFLFQAGIIQAGASNLGKNDLYIVSLGGKSSKLLRFTAQNEDEKFHLVIARKVSEYTVTINNLLYDTVDMGEVKDLGNFSPVIMNSSDVGFVRVWNYALSADEIATLYNNGDPMGYVVPKLYRQFGPAVEPRAKTFEFNIGSPYSMVAIGPQKYPYDCFYRVDYVVEEWDYQPNTVNLVGFLGIGGAEVVSGNDSWYSLEQAKVGELQSFLVKMPGSGTPAIYIYGGNDDETVTARHLKVTINSITPVGLLAEYLPQNLMYGRDDKTIATSWLDSAKQMPLSDEYMDPLFQSIGGYDMAANGAPEILYNE